MLHTEVMGMRVRGGDEVQCVTHSGDGLVMRVSVLYTEVMGMRVRGGDEVQCVTHSGDGAGDEGQGW